MLTGIRKKRHARPPGACREGGGGRFAWWPLGSGRWRRLRRLAERPHAQQKHPGATAASRPSPERPSCIRGVPDVRNAGVVGGSGESLTIMRHCPGFPAYAPVGRRRIQPSAACRHRESSRRLSRWRCFRAQCRSRNQDCRVEFRGNRISFIDNIIITFLRQALTAATHNTRTR